MPFVPPNQPLDVTLPPSEHDSDHLPLGGTDRRALRRLLETRGLVGGLSRPHVTVRLQASDGTRLAASLLPGPPGAPAVVHLHGFGAHRRKPAYAGFVDVLAEHLTVLSVDLRGHGQSAGRSSLGDREVLDAQAAVAWLRARGHDWVAIVGISMGATSAVHTLAHPDPPDAVVAISAPARLHPQPRSAPMARLHTMWTSRPHRVGMRVVTGVRVVPVDDWAAPPDPADVVAASPVPVLLVHGIDDHFFDIAEWDEAARVADVPLWREPTGFGHAEDGLTIDFGRRIAAAVRAAHDQGRFPDREDCP